MNIFHPLLCYYPSQAGGPANTLFWLNTSLDKSRFTTTVLSTDFGLHRNVVLEDTANEISGPNHQVKFLKTKGLSYVKLGIINLSRSDIVQFSSLFFSPTLPFLLSALAQKKKVIISPRGELYPSALSISSKKKKIWLNIIKRLQTKIYFHATNEFEKELIKRNFPEAAGVKVIPNYIKLPKKKEAVRDTNKLLFIGRINPIKNIDILIKSVAQASKLANKDIKLLIAGSARLPYELVYLEKLKKLIVDLNLGNQVKFLGHVEGEAKDELIATSYALCLPSQSENFGNVVLESLAQGTPVIASKNTPWEVLNETRAGYWVYPEVNELSISIAKMFNIDSNTYETMSNNAYELCKEKFDIKSNISDWEEFYNKLHQ